MGCEITKDENGRVMRIACSRGNPRCKFCGRPSTKLCDYKIGNKTCDAKMCTECATNLGYELDYCPTHAGGSK